MHNFGMKISTKLQYSEKLPKFYGINRYEESLKFYDALDWLVTNYTEFPMEIPEGYTEDISFDLYKNWKLVRTLPDNEIFFGNCLQPGITCSIFDEYKDTIK